VVFSKFKSAEREREREREREKALRNVDEVGVVVVVQ
jgi:hypothetical protein